MLSKRLSRWNFDHEKKIINKIYEKKNIVLKVHYNCVPCVIFIYFFSLRKASLCMCSIADFWRVTLFAECFFYTFLHTWNCFLEKSCRSANVIYRNSVYLYSVGWELLCGIFYAVMDKWEVIPILCYTN